MRLHLPISKEEVSFLIAIKYVLFTLFYTSALHIPVSTKAHVIPMPELRGKSRQRGMIIVGL